MATAAKNYRKTGRLPRATTKLSTFMNGMFYTEQIVPDGYAKTLINYDIDYTGNCLKPKMGRIQYDDIDNEYYKWLDLTYQANVNVFDKPINMHPAYAEAYNYQYQDPTDGGNVYIVYTREGYVFEHEDSHGKADVWLDPNYGLGLAKNDNYIKSDNATQGIVDNKFRTIYNGSIVNHGSLMCSCKITTPPANAGATTYGWGFIYEDSAPVHNISISATYDLDQWLHETPVLKFIFNTTDTVPEDNFTVYLDIYDDTNLSFTRYGFMFNPGDFPGWNKLELDMMLPEPADDVVPYFNKGANFKNNHTYRVYISFSDSTHYDYINPVLMYETDTDPIYNLDLGPITLVDKTNIESHRPGVKSVQLNNNIYTFNSKGATSINGYDVWNTHEIPNQMPDVQHYFIPLSVDTFKVAQHYFYNTSSDESEMKLCHQLMPVRVTTPDPITAATTGFNMLLDDPYEFHNQIGSTFNVLGAFIYGNNSYTDPTKPILSPDLGSETTLKVYYQYYFNNSPTSATIKIYYANTGVMKSAIDTDNLTWELITDSVLKPSSLPFECDFKIPCNYFMLRIVLNEGTTSETVWSSGIYDTTNLDLKNVELKNIDITEAKQFVTFGNYIGAYDIADYNTAIFFSAPNDPGYFPFPDNTIDFLEEIYAVHKYLNMLLVVTSNALYLITPGNTIQDSSIKKILNNINVTKWDALDATVLNDQFCIKISDQYYIFKPNSYTSDATDIKHYLISAPIAKLLDVDGVKESTIIDILNEYLKTVIVKCSQANIQGSTGSACVLNNVDYINILDKFSYTYKSDLHYVFTLNVKLKVSEFSKGEVYATNKNMFNLDKHNIYIDFSGDHPVVIVDESCLVDHSHISDTSYRVSYDWADNKLILKMHLIYDITNRTWRMYMEPTRNILVTEMNVSDYPDSVITYMNPRALIYNNTKDSYRSKFIDLHTGEYLESFNMQVAAESSTPLFGRFAITKLTYDSNTYNPELASVPDETQTYRFDIALSPDNILDEVVDIYTYLDTGNISLDDSFMKRFRELQLNLVNYELTKIPFHVNFKLDGQERIDDTNFRIQHITDVNDPDYGLIYITPVEVENLNLYSVTTFADDIEESDCWCLDLSKFPDNERVTLRFGLLGKGRRASVQILNDSLKKYEIADFNWVYRVMNGR